MVKDFDLTDAKDAGQAFVEVLALFGFALLSERIIEAEGCTSPYGFLRYLVEPPIRMPSQPGLGRAIV